MQRTAGKQDQPHVTNKPKRQQVLQMHTYQLSKESAMDNVYLLCFLLLLQKKSIHPTFIASRKSPNLKIQCLQTLWKAGKSTVFREILSNFPYQLLPLLPIDIKQTELERSKQGCKEKANLLKEMVLASWSAWSKPVEMMYGYMASTYVYTCVHVRLFLGSGLTSRWCQNLSCCQEQSSRCPPLATI